MDNIPIIWINLDRSNARRNFFENQLERYNISNHTRISAVDGSDLNLNNYKTYTTLEDNLSKYELACSLSHLEAIKKARELSYNYALIMEDDCNFEYIKYQMYSVKELINKMNNENPNWEILQLCTSGRLDQNQNRAKDKTYIRPKFKNCTTCYLINKKGINKNINIKSLTIKQADYFIYENYKTYHTTKPYFTYNYSKEMGSCVHNQGLGSKKTQYKREDENKRFWDLFYFKDSGIKDIEEIKNKKYKIVVLILDSDNNEIYKFNRLVWKQYMNSNKNVLCLFLRYSDNLSCKYRLDLKENTLYVPGVEEYSCQAIYTKTLKGFKFCHENLSYDYLLRTNLSSFWVFDKLLNYMKCRQHGKYILGRFMTNKDECSSHFLSGTSIMIPNNFIPLIFNHTKTTKIMDDIEISEFYRSQGVQFFNYQRKLNTFFRLFECKTKIEIDTLFEKYKNWEIVYYRVKNTENRTENDKYCLERLLLKYYSKSIDSEINNKIKNLKNKEIVNIFVSPKVKAWSGYFATEILNLFPSYNIISSPCELNRCDIIITHVKQKVEYLTNQAINIVINGENYTTKNKFDISISTHKENNSKINIYIPFLYQSLKEHRLSINTEIYKKNKTKFCAYMYSADHTHRVKYFKLLSQYKKVDGLGKSCNNVVSTTNRILYNNDITWLDQAVKIYSDYKFVIAVENKMKDGYVTEKIINPMIAGSIPIYWGPESVFEYINKKRVIYVKDFDNDEKLLNYIKKLDTIDSLYNSIISEPIYLSNKKPEDVFNLFKNNLKNVFM